jgi:hypothetical protein
MMTQSQAVQAQDDAQSFTAQLDLRLVNTDVKQSYLDGGLGLGRLDEQHDGLQLGRAFLDYSRRFGDTLDAHLTLDTYGDGGKTPLDVTEAFLEWRPYPLDAWRWRVRFGAFYPPLSLENRGPGWQNVYALSSSAINTWIGEELRTIGSEVSATWLGSHSGGLFDLSVIAALYGWNDPAGTLLFDRGWALHDRQTGLFGGLPKVFPESTARQRLELFHEIDHRPGYYAGLQLEAPNRLVIRALHYDNRADPAATNGYESAWLTRFDSLGMRLEFSPDWTFIAQWMKGDTGVGSSSDGRGGIILDFNSYFGLLSRELGKHRLSVRYDDFYTETVRGSDYFDSYQQGQAWTFAYTYTRDDHWQLVAEALRVSSKLEQRNLVGAPEDSIERTLQLALRYTF